MEYKKKINISLVVFFMVSIVSFYIMNPVRIGLCSKYDISCGNLFAETIGVPSFLFSVSFIVILFLLRWLKESIFISWLRFTKYYLPIAAVFVFVFPITDSSIVGIDRELMSWFLSGLFLFISIIVIFYKYFRQPK